MPARSRPTASAGCGSALTQIDALIQTQPNNPYFHELKGQALLESAQPAAAIAPLRRAAALAPNAALIRIMLGQALVATGENKYSDEAISLLRVAMQREPDAPEVYSQLAMAYGRKGDLAEADLASAQAALARGDMKTARELAARAKTRFPTGSPGWVSSDDIVGLKEPRTSSSAAPVSRSDRPGTRRPKGPRNEPFRPLALAAAIALAGVMPAAGAGLLRAAARRDREDHQGLPAQAPRGAAGGDGGA